MKWVEKKQTSSGRYFAKETGEGPMMRREDPTTAERKEAACREMDDCLQVGWYRSWMAVCYLSQLQSRLNIRKANQVAIIHCMIVFYYRVVQLPSRVCKIVYMKPVRGAKKGWGLLF